MGTPPAWVQQPRTDYPGIEFFALAPNRTIALGPRLSLAKTGVASSVPASGVAGNITDLTLLPNFGYGDAIAIVKMWVQYIPSDAAGKLQISATRMGVGTGSGTGIAIDLGFPTATLNAPVATVLTNIERDTIITEADLRWPGSAWVTNGPLIMSSWVTVTNTDAGAAHSFNLGNFCIFHVLKGLVV